MISVSNLSHHRLMEHGNELANRPLALVIFETGLLVIIALTALVGNTCVLYVFYKTPHLRSVTSYYILTLAVSDAIMCVLVMPVTLTAAAFGRDVLGAFVGKSTFFIFAELVLSSLYTTSLLGINRYFCVVKPAKYRAYFKPRFAALSIVVCWVFASCFNIAIHLTGVAEFVFFPGRCMYFPLILNGRTYQLFTGLYQSIFAVTPIMSALLCNWKIYKHIKLHRNSVASTINNRQRAGSSPSHEELRVTKSLMAVVMGFVVCWIPNSTILNINAYTKLPRMIELSIVYFAFLSSAINPILYNIFNRPFRRRALQLLHQRCFATAMENRSGTSHDHESTNRPINRPPTNQPIIGWLNQLDQ